jgi:predicted O-linked N-acetylglucosamine transferase (SPINDLY family)
MSEDGAGPESLARRHFLAGRFEEALALLDAAVAAEPNRAPLWNNRGAALAAMKRFDAAYESFGRALALEPEFAGARANRAHALMQLHRPDEAIPDYERLLARDPDAAFARGSLIRAKLQACDWRGLQEQWERARGDMRAGRPAIPPMLVTALMDAPEEQLSALRLLAAAKYPLHMPPLWPGERYNHKRIRVAYLSADFHAHATATLMAGVFEAHDRNRFETFAISFGTDDASPMRRRLVDAFEHFFAVGQMNDADIAKLLHERVIPMAGAPASWHGGPRRCR